MSASAAALKRLQEQEEANDALSADLCKLLHLGDATTGAETGAETGDAVRRELERLGSGNATKATRSALRHLAIADDLAADPPSPLGLPPQALPMGHKLFVWAKRAAYGHGWFMGTITGGRVFDANEIRYSVSFDANASLRDDTRDDVPIAEMRLFKSDLKDGGPYAKTGRAYVVYERAIPGMRIFADPVSWRSRRPLMICTYTPEKGMNEYAETSKKDLNALTRSPLKTTLCHKIQWLRDQHQHLPPSCIDVKKHKNRSVSLVAPVAKSAFTIVSELQKYDVEHISLVRERHFEVQFWGFCEHNANYAMEGMDVLSCLGPRTDARPSLRPVPYSEEG